VTGGWRKLHDEFNNLYSLSSIIRMIMSRKMRWAGNVICLRKKKKKKRNAYRILVGKGMILKFM
jgi:hypothetical protein